MKKILCILLILVLFMSSCEMALPGNESSTPNDSPSETPNESSPASSDGSTVESYSKIRETTPIIPEETIPYKDKYDWEWEHYPWHSFDFGSYEELQWNFLPGANAENSILQYQKEKFGEVYDKHFDREGTFTRQIEFYTQRGGAVIPYFDGEPMPLNYTDIKISVWLQEKGQICYYVPDELFSAGGGCIDVFLVDHLIGQDLPVDTSGVEMLLALGKITPNLSKESTYEIDLILADRTVKALVFENKIGEKDIQIYFYYDDYGILIYNDDSNVLPLELLMHLSFK